MKSSSVRGLRSSYPFSKTQRFVLMCGYVDLVLALEFERRLAYNITLQCVGEAPSEQWLILMTESKCGFNSLEHT